jgi:hypothetical protein
MFAEKPITFRDEIEQFLQTAPSLQEIVSYKIPEYYQERMQYLMGASNRGALTADETAELHEYLRVEHFLTMLYLNALKKLKEGAG